MCACSPRKLQGVSGMVRKDERHIAQCLFTSATWFLFHDFCGFIVIWKHLEGVNPLFSCINWSSINQPGGFSMVGLGQVYLYRLRFGHLLFRPNLSSSHPSPLLSLNG